MGFTNCTRLIAVLFVLPAFCRAAPASSPTTQPGPLADRLTFLTLQLSSTEESIKAVNIALRGAGYKAALAADRAADAEKGNELMDRKGGAPIPWDQFYGKTARDFIAPLPPGTRITIKGKGQIVYPTNDPIRRPAQMDYIYRANSEQAAKARAEAAALGQKIDALLARRRQLEAEQSAIWATISWESMQSRDIPLRPLYRFKLKDSKPGPTARTQMLRFAILFLRTTDKAIADGLNIVSTRQEEALRDLGDAVQPAESKLRESIADAMLADNLDAVDLNLGKELLAPARRMAATCKNMSDAYRLAIDGDVAHDDTRKLRFRAALQESMLDFAESFGQMDDLITKLAETWNIAGEKGVPSEDKLPFVERKATKADPASPIAVADAPQSLFDGKTLAGWEGDTRYWSVVDGVIRGKSTDKSNNYLFTKGEFQNFRLEAQFKFISGNSGILFRCEPAAPGQSQGGYEAAIYPPNAIGRLAFEEKVLVRPDADLLKKTYHSAGWNSYTIEANGEHIRLWINDQLMVDREHHGAMSGRIALKLYGPTEVYFRDLRITRLPAADARPAIATPNPAAVAIAPDTGESLFDGKTLAGWEGDTRYWSVVDGAIRGRSTDKSHNYLFAKGEIQNFRLEAQFKFISGNSGIRFRCEPAAAGQSQGGYEADIYLPNAVGKLGFDERVLVRPDAALVKKTYRPADWNSYTIEANGEHIRLWINDQLTVDCQHHGPASGRIGFELYGPTEIYFRDLRIKPLP